MKLRVQSADDELVAVGGEQQRQRGHLEQPGELGAVDHATAGRTPAPSGSRRTCRSGCRRTARRRRRCITRKPSAAPIDQLRAAGRADEDAGVLRARSRRRPAGRRPGRGRSRASPLIRSGIALCENGGAMTRNAVIRTPASMHRLDPRQVDRDVHVSRRSSRPGIFSNSSLVKRDHLGDHPVPGDRAGRSPRRPPWARRRA